LADPAATTTPPLPDELAGIIDEVVTFAKLGTTVSPPGAQTGGFAGFEGFVAQANQENVLEARPQPSGSLVLRPSTRYPEPSGFRTVVAGYGSDQVRYTVAKHQITGTNRYGQTSVEFPFCLVNLAAWRQAPCDLRLAEWYRSEQDAVAKYAPPPPAPEPEPTDCIASFAGGVQVELRRENRSRFLMWEVRNGRRTRRSDFSSPFLDHAKRTAACWYVEPVEDWHDLQEIKPRRMK
jgi:hypothetical protein